MRLYYIRQRKKVIGTIEKSKLQDVCEIIESDSGLHFILKLKTDRTDRYISSQLEKRGIRVNALSEYFFTRNEVSHLFLVNYSNLNVEKVEAACEEIWQVLQ